MSTYIVNVHKFLYVSENLERMHVGLDFIDDGSPTRFKWRKPVEKTGKVCQYIRPTPRRPGLWNLRRTLNNVVRPYCPLLFEMQQ